MSNLPIRAGSEADDVQRVDASSGYFPRSDGNNTLRYQLSVVLLPVYLLPFHAETVLSSLPQESVGQSGTQG